MKQVFKTAGFVLWALISAGPGWAQEPTPAPGEQEVLEFLESRVPGAYEVVLATRPNDPEGYEQQLGELGAQIAYYQQVKKRSPEYAESLLREQFVLITSRSLAGQIRALDPGAERDALVDEL